MKNLYKKIGALVLAGMVVAGGFAASGAQSFASSEVLKYHGGLELLSNKDLKNVDNEDRKELYGMLPSGDYQISKGYVVKSLLIDAFEDYLKENDYDGGFSPMISNLRIGRSPNYMKRRLAHLLSRGYALVQFKDNYYAIVKK